MQCQVNFLNLSLPAPALHHHFEKSDLRGPLAASGTRYFKDLPTGRIVGERGANERTGLSCYPQIELGCWVAHSISRVRVLCF